MIARVAFRQVVAGLFETAEACNLEGMAGSEVKNAAEPGYEGLLELLHVGGGVSLSLQREAAGNLAATVASARSNIIVGLIVATTTI